MSGQCRHCKEDLGVGVGFRCGGCRNVSFCDRECQGAGWPAHKTDCKEMQAANAATAATPARFTGDASRFDARALRAAAARGDAGALYNLGLCYQHGLGGVAVDFAEAVRNYRLCAASRDPPPEVFNALAICYADGTGVVADESEAARYWTLGAQAGDVESQAKLGQALQKGLGVDIDAVAGYGWCKRAADAGHPDAQCGVGVALETGYGVAKDVDEGIKWYRRAAVQGDADAMYNLGTCYFSGKGVPQSNVEFVTWLQRAKLAGNPRAGNRLDELLAAQPNPVDRAQVAAWVASVTPFPPPRRGAGAGAGAGAGW